MPFPLTVGEHTWQTGPDLVAAVVADARAGGGTVIADELPSVWVTNLVNDQQLEPQLAMGLVAALLQRHQEPLPVAEAARLARRLGSPALGELLLLSLDALDIGLLLTAEADSRAVSVEDVVLDAAAALLDLTDDARRAQLLARLRYAGRTTLETRIIARFSTPEEIAGLLPAVLIEGLQAGAVDALVEGLGRGGTVTDAIVDALRYGLPAEDLDTLLAALQSADSTIDVAAIRARLTEV